MDYAGAKAYILDRLERELPRRLTYHGIHHTLDVVAATQELARLEGVPETELPLLLTAALFHDSGFLINNRKHEKLGCRIVRQQLPAFDYAPEEIDRICRMIRATKIPQAPKSHLAAILCDADLDYLGRNDFYEIGQTLFEELRTYRILKTESEWNRLQVKFLSAHVYHTDTNRRRRDPVKRQHLDELRELVASYPTID
jgi:uncharacterized protein